MRTHQSLPVPALDLMPFYATQLIHIPYLIPHTFLFTLASYSFGHLTADATPALPLIGGWVIGAVAFLQLVSLGMQVLRWNQAAKREAHPQPLEIKDAAEFLPRQLFEDHAEQNQREHEHLFARLGGIDRSLRAEMKQDTDGLHEKINNVGREVSEHSATLELQNQRLAQIDAKLDRLIERRPQ